MGGNSRSFPNWALRTVCIAILVAFCLTASARAGDWPQFRGPTGQGHVENAKLPLTWSSEKNVTWKTPLPGEAWSSPVIVDGKIYLTNAVPQGDDFSLRALSLDAKSGKVLWDKEIFRQDGTTAPRIHRKNSHASPTPIVHDNLLYVHFGHQGTACLDLKGKVVWQNRSFGYPPVHGNGGAPIIVDDALIFTCDGRDKPFVLALDRRTGKQLWKAFRGTDAVRKFSFATPLAITVEGKKQVVCPGSDVVCAYDPKTGREIWRVDYDGYSVIPRPVYGHGMVYVCTGWGTAKLYAIRPTGTGNVTKTHVAWVRPRNVSKTPSQLLIGDEIYGITDTGFAYCVDAKTGREHWLERLGETYSASPIHSDGKIYFLSEDGTGIIVAASKKFKELARNELKERTLASYAVADGALFIRTAGNLYRIEEK